MNWKLLKEKYPHSERELRAWSKTTGFDNRSLIVSFLETKGYSPYTSFITYLKDYEKQQEQKYEVYKVVEQSALFGIEPKKI